MVFVDEGYYFFLVSVFFHCIFSSDCVGIAFFALKDPDFFSVSVFVCVEVVDDEYVCPFTTFTFNGSV